MIIDEEKLKRIASSKTKGPKGMFPSLKFEKKSNKKKTVIEIIRIVIGVSIAAGMIFGAGALVWTLANEAATGVETLSKKSQEKQPSAKDVQVIFLPSGTTK